MTTREFSDSFDTLLNSYANKAAFGEDTSKADIRLDEYEKSVLLTQAQDLVVKSYFYNNQNQQGQGFDDSERRQVDFSSLIKVATLTQSSAQTNVFDDRGILFDMPKKTSGSTDVLFILNEKLVCNTLDGKRKNYVVVPINYKEYDREMSKPYAQPLKKQAWRLFQNNSYGFDIKTELIPRWNLTKEEEIVDYRIRYIRRPKPIILVDLPDDLYIDGYKKAQNCELNPILHPEILKKAVELTISTRIGRVENNEKE